MVGKVKLYEIDRTREKPRMSIVRKESNEKLPKHFTRVVLCAETQTSTGMKYKEWRNEWMEKYEKSLQYDKYKPAWKANSVYNSSLSLSSSVSISVEFSYCRSLSLSLRESLECSQWTKLKASVSQSASRLNWKYDGNGGEMRRGRIRWSKRKGVGESCDVIVEGCPGNGKRSPRRDADVRRHHRRAVKINLDLG